MNTRRGLAAILAAALLVGLLPLEALAATPPTASADPVTTDEDQATTVTLQATDPDGTAITSFDVVTGPGNGVLGTPTAPDCTTLPLCTATVSYDPNPDWNGSDGFTFTATDSEAETSSAAAASITVTPLNDDPTAGDDAPTVPEDASATTIDVLANDSADPDTGETLTVTAVGTATDGTTSLVAGSVRYAPDPDYFGADSFTYTISDGNGGSDTATVDVTVSPVNDEPDFAAGGNQSVGEDSGPHSVAGWATGITAGPSNESAQVLTFTATPVNATLFAAGPAISVTTGTLTFTPAANAYGTTTVNVSLTDDGGTAGGGDDTSPTRSFTVTITAANDNPTAVDDSLTVAEDSGNTSNINVLGNDSSLPDAPETLTVTGVGTASHGASTLHPVQGVRYAPATDYNGADAFTYTISDGNGGTATATVNVTVTPVNDPPTANGDTLTVGEDSGDSTVDVLANDSSAPDAGETLTVTAVGTATHGTASLVAGVVHYAPAADYAGSDAFTYTISDGNGGTDTATVNVTVTPLNDQPTATDDTVSVAEDATAATILVLANDSAAPDTGETLTVTAVGTAGSGTAAIGPGGLSVTYAPDADANGADAFTYTISDGNGGSDTATVDVTVTAVNDEPSFTKGADQSVAEDAGAQSVAGWATAISAGPADEADQVVSFVVSNDNTGLFSAQPAVSTAGTLTYTPAADANGSATISVRAGDDGGTAGGGDDTSPTQTFTITVGAVNDEPSFTKGADQSVAEDAGAQSVTGWATGITAGAANEGGQSLTFEVVSNTNPSLFAVGPSVSAAGTLAYTPVADASGVATIQLRLADDGGTAGGGDDTSATVTFTITIDAVNDEPSFAKGADETVLEDAGAQSVAGWATTISPGPADESGQALTFEVVSNSNASLFSAGPTVATDGTLAYTPAADANGSATVQLRLADDGGTAGGGDDTSLTQTFTITVTAVNDEPSFTKGADPSAPEDAALQSFTGWATAISAGPADEVGQALAFEVTANSNPTLFMIAPAIDAATGTLTFRPAANRAGTADLEVHLVDDGGTTDGGDDASATAAFTITVEGANDPPVASNDLVTVRIGGPVTLPVLGNDSGGPGETGDPVTITAVNEGSRGIATITGGGTGLSYDPTGCTTGSDTITYTLTDGGGLTDTASVLITIAAPTTYPVADAPRPGFVTNSTMGSTMPVKLSWCGLTSGTTIKSYRLQQGTNGGAPGTVISSTTATSSTRNLSMSSTYDFQVRVTDNKSRTSAYAPYPRFKVVRTQDSSPSITYSSGWKTSTASGNSGTARYTSSAGKSATFTYTGRSFAIVGTKGSTRGSFNVYVDGLKVTSSAVSARASSTAYRRVLYWKTLAYGTHTVRLVAVGNGRVDLDAIVTIQAP